MPRYGPGAGVGFMMLSAALITGGIMVAALLAQGAHQINGNDVILFTFLIPTALLMAIAMGVSWLIMQAVLGTIHKKY